MRRIYYGIDLETGLVVSRLTEHGHTVALACPTYDFANFGKDGDFRGPIPAPLERIEDIFATLLYARVRWTRKIPTSIKNEHRQFFGMKPLTT